MSNLPWGRGKPLETTANTGCSVRRHLRNAKGGRKAPALGGARAPSARWRGNGPPRLTVSWSERMASRTGTEILPRLLREAAVEDHSQWAKALVGRYPANKLMVRGPLGEGELSPPLALRSCDRALHSVLAVVSNGFPHLRDRLPTCSSPFRHSHGATLLPPRSRSTCMPNPRCQRSF